MTDPNGGPLAGNIAAWPAGVPVRAGRLSFTIAARVKERVETHPAQGASFIIPGNYRLLVGRDIRDATAFRNRVNMTLLSAGLIALGVGLLAMKLVGRVVR